MAWVFIFWANRYILSACIASADSGELPGLLGGMPMGMKVPRVGMGTAKAGKVHAESQPTPRLNALSQSTLFVFGDSPRLCPDSAFS